MSKTVNCTNCKDWKEFFPILQGQQILAWNHNMKFPSEGIFKYCPWCGLELKEDPNEADD